MNNRACILWDMSINTHGLGDTSTILLGIELLRETHHVDKVDVYIVCDKNSPNRGSWEDTFLSTGNYFTFFPGYINLLYTNPHLGNVSILDSDESLYDIFKYLESEYVCVYPSLEVYRKKFESWIDITDRVIEFHDTYGYIPKIDIIDSLKHWAYTTFREYAPKLPIVVHLRNNRISGMGGDRNADFLTWFQFFNSCKDMPIQFIMIGSYLEIDERYLVLDNVVHMKKYHTTVAKDIALIYCSLLFMGTCSGLVTIPVFADLPHVVFRWNAHHIHTGGSHCKFLKSPHALFCTNEYIELLQDAFKYVLSNVDKRGWVDKANTWKDYTGPKLESTSSWV